MTTKNRVLAHQHLVALRQRRKQGLKPIFKPWDYLGYVQLRQLVAQAYRVAAFEVLQEMQDRRFIVSDSKTDLKSQTATQMRELFCDTLADAFRDLLRSDAVARAGCWPVSSRTPGIQNYRQIAAERCENVPDDWRSHNPIFKKITAASLTGTRTAPAFEGVKDPLMQAFFRQPTPSAPLPLVVTITPDVTKTRYRGIGGVAPDVAKRNGIKRVEL